jgi:FdhD protein
MPEAVHVPCKVERWQAGHCEQVNDELAAEVPIVMQYHGINHAVMLATPSDLTDYAYGFTVSEGLVDCAADIQAVEVIPQSTAIELRISIKAEHFARVLARRRQLTGRTSCGICGTETLDQLQRPLPPCQPAFRLSARELQIALQQLSEQQPLNAVTGSVHAAAWVLPGSGLQWVREDVGRHNALDKTLGALLQAATDPKTGYVLITSRASYEMVYKTAALGVGVLVAVSAPTALAVQIAEQCALTLVGFTRAGRHVIYTHPERLQS